MSQYELMFIVSSDLSADKSKEITESVKKLLEKEGKVVELKEWNKNKTLAYPISKHTVGTYWLVTFEAVDKTIPGISGKLKANPDVIRYLIIKKD